VLEATLLERDAELREIRGALDRARDGAGATVLLEAPAGAGKSALLATAVAHAKDADVTILSARAADLEREYGFGIVRQLFEGPLTERPDVRDRLLAGAARAAERAILPDGGPAATDGFATLHGIYWLAANMAQEGPLVIAVDDVHWADQSSLQALAYLASRIADVPIALLVAMRPHEPGSPDHLLDALRAGPEAVRLTPQALTPDGVTRLVRARLEDVDREVCAAFHEATGGNPFLLLELMLAVGADNGAAAVDPVAVRETAIIPIGDRVVRRIRQLGERAPALASAMAVLGAGGSLAIAGELAGVEPGEAGRMAHDLRRIDVLAAEDPFDFVHPLVGRSIYDTIDAHERNRLHRGAADLLRRSASGAIEAVAAQLATVPPAGSSETASVLIEAGAAARARGAPDEAVRWLERALVEDASEPPRVTLLEALGRTRADLRDPAAIPPLTEALELADDADTRVRIATALPVLYATAGLWEEGLTVVQLVEHEVARASPERVAEFEAVRTAQMLFDPERTDLIERDRPRLERVAAGAGWGARALTGLLAVQALHRHGDGERARSLAEQALADGHLVGERGAGSWAAVHPLSTLVELDAVHRAEEVCDVLVSAAVEQGSVINQLTGLAFRGWIDVRGGDLAAGEAKLRSAIDAANTTGQMMMITTAVYLMLDVLLERPGHDDLIGQLEGLELPEAFARTWSGTCFMLVRGQMRLIAGRREDAVADLRAAHAIQAGLQWGPVASPVRAALALALPSSQREQALALAAEEVELARAEGLARSIGWALRARGTLEGGKRGLGLLRESVAMLGDDHLRLERARSLVALGAALRRAQQRRDARDELAAGLALAHACGAHRLAERARTELHAAGARPRRDATSGVAALTPSERRVADLAARGAGNAEIAQELFVTLKTVETHLTRTYSKLDLSGAGARRKLAAALAHA